MSRSVYKYLLLGPICLVVMAVVGFAASPTLADCADPPAPEVDWRKCVLQKRDFSGVDLSKAKLKYGRFIRGSFVKSVLVGADLRRAKFLTADFRDARLDNARLNDADFTKANLSGASLKNTDLTRTQFQKANLRGANLTGAKLRHTVFLEADLSGATWRDGKTVCAEGSIGQCR